MKVSIDIRNGYFASLCKCDSCEHEVLFIRPNRQKVINSVCPKCRKHSMCEVEPPWVGVIEEMKV